MHSDTARRCPKTPTLHKKTVLSAQKFSIGSIWHCCFGRDSAIFEACLFAFGKYGRPAALCSRRGLRAYARLPARLCSPCLRQVRAYAALFFIFCAAAALTQISESGSQRLKLRTEPQKGAFLSEIGGNSSAVPEIRHLPCQESRIAVHCCNACRSDCFSSSVNCR